MKKSEIQIAIQARGAQYIRLDDVSDKCAVVTFLCILNVVVLSQLERMQQPPTHNSTHERKAAARKAAACSTEACSQLRGGRPSPRRKAIASCHATFATRASDSAGRESGWPLSLLLPTACRLGPVGLEAGHGRHSTVILWAGHGLPPQSIWTAESLPSLSPPSLSTSSSSPALPPSLPLPLPGLSSPDSSVTPSLTRRLRRRVSGSVPGTTLTCP